MTRIFELLLDFVFNKEPIVRDVRSITGAGFLAISGAAAAMAAMSADLIGVRVGVWAVTMSLGLYGLALGLGRWLDVRAEQERQSDCCPRGSRGLGARGPM